MTKVNHFFNIVKFKVLHFLAATFFFRELGNFALYGFLVGFLLLTGSNIYLWKEKKSWSWLEGTSYFPRNSDYDSVT
jgi:4-hydroxybenzoate polyprenyltransferase